ncbi:LysR family transcriptional regulator [Rhodococcus yananensis]|uniref:LysR family transcriptional regulator n=1 Tax=Rhodococcus yananensis TaxID=2879464 RepID=UPI001CF8A5C2|nr:LysR family transcriptional regulator [Rhodococcus yananensis]
MIDVGALRALRSVAELGTVAQAAEELGFTASAVSQQIKRLEKQLGVAVLAPAGRKVVLTPAGQVIVESAPEVFQTLERCLAAAQSVAQGTPRGALRVAAFSTAIRGLLAPAVAAFITRYPDVQVRIFEEDADQALRSVDAGIADLAVVHDADDLPTTLPSSLTARLLHTDVGDVIMHRTHPLTAIDTPLTDVDLAGHAWVTSPRGTVCHEWFRRLVADIPEEPDVRHMIDDFSSQLSLVMSGQVIALVPRLARPPLGEGLISRQLQRPPKREVRAAWRRSAEASPALQALLVELSVQTPPAVSAASLGCSSQAGCGR